MKKISRLRINPSAGNKNKLDKCWSDKLRLEELDVLAGGDFKKSDKATAGAKRKKST